MYSRVLWVNNDYKLKRKLWNNHIDIVSKKVSSVLARELEP